MKLKRKVRSLAATTLLAVSAQSLAGTITVPLGINGAAAGRSFTNTGIFKVYAEGEAIPVSIDGSTTFTIPVGSSLDEAIAGYVNGVDTGNNANNTKTEYGVVGFTVRSKNYFAILSVTADGGNDKVTENAGQLGPNYQSKQTTKSLFKNVGDSLTWEVVKIFDTTGAEAVDIGGSNPIATNVITFSNATFGNFSIGTASDGVEIYDDSTDPDTLLETLLTSAASSFNTPAKILRVRANVNPTFSFRDLSLSIDDSTFPVDVQEVASFDAISQVYDAGYAESAQDAATIETELKSLYPYATVGDANAKSIEGWTSSDYDASKAGSYTFTATLAADFEVGFKDDDSSATAPTVSVQVKATTEVDSFAAVATPKGGSLTNPVFDNAAAIIAALPTAVKVNGTNDTATVSWAEQDAVNNPYDKTKAGTYTFVPTVTALPAGYVETDGTTIPNVTVTLKATDFVDNEPADAKVTNAAIGKQTALGFKTLFGDIADQTSATGVISVDLDGTVYEVTLKVTPTAEDGENPLLASRPLNNEDYFIGVKTTTEATTDIKCLAVSNVTTLTEGLTFEVTKIHNKTANKDVTDGSVALNFKKFEYGKALATEGHSYTTDKDSTPILAAGGTVDFTSGFTALPETTVAMSAAPNTNDGGNSSFDLSGITFDLFEQTPTPAIGLQVTQTDNLVNWSVQEERDVKEYQLVNVETGKVVDVIIANGSKTYAATVEAGVVIELVVVDHSGKSQAFTPSNGNSLTVDYKLVPGWNLIATVGTDSDLSEVEAKTTGTMWSWDGAKYVKANHSKAFSGIWVYAPKAANVKATAIKAGSTLSLQPGWTLAGPTNNVNRPEDVITFAWASEYAEILETHEALIKGQAYWFFVTEKTELTVDSE